MYETIMDPNKKIPKDVAKYMCKFDKNYSFRVSMQTIRIFMKTLYYFLRNKKELRIHGFIEVKYPTISPTRVKAYFTGAVYDRPEYTSVTIHADRKFRDFMNRRRAFENFGDKIKVEEDI